MKNQSITINQLRAFHAVVVAGCRYKYSEETSVSRLQKAVGVKLFEKNPEGRQSLSAAGSSVFSIAVKVLAYVDFLEAGGAATSQEEAGE